jgi:hypothetical protein
MGNLAFDVQILAKTPGRLAQLRRVHSLCRNTGPILLGSSRVRLISATPCLLGRAAKSRASD